MRMRKFVAVGLLASLGGCVTASEGMQTKFRDATSEYNRMVRWGDVDRAAEHLPAESQQAFLDQYEVLRDELVIVDYELVRLDLEPMTGIASCRARVEWHLDRELVVKTTEIDQIWQFHGGKFVLVDERRASGDPLNLFAETAEDHHPYLPGLDAYRKANAIGQENKKKKGKQAAG